jgi:Transposase DDE domain
MAAFNTSLYGIENLAFLFGYLGDTHVDGQIIQRLKLFFSKKVGSFRKTKFSPDVAFNIFIRQILSPDGSCRQAMADAVAAGLIDSSSLDTGAYCHARARLPESLFTECARLFYDICYEQLHSKFQRWHGFHLKAIDGTTLSMPDTPENQKAYPQPDTQSPEVGFPLLRMVICNCLMTGAVIDYAYAPYQGKLTGEHSLFRSMIDNCVNSMDLILGDRYYASFWLLYALQKKEAAGLFEAHASRTVDWTKGHSIDTLDHIVEWKKPSKPEWMSQDEYEQIPDVIEVREFKHKNKILVTTILDNEKFSKNKLGELYFQRWRVETDIGVLKTTMHMDVLRCKNPENIAREIGAHFVAYNFTRTLVARAARLKKSKKPREISYKSAIQIINAFKTKLANATCISECKKIIFQMMTLLVKEHIPNRPGRKEPRAVKRRPKSYPRLQTSRKAARAYL